MIFPKGWTKPEHLIDLPQPKAETKPAAPARIKVKLIPFAIDLLHVLNGYLLAYKLPSMPEVPQTLLDLYPMIDVLKAVQKVESIVGLHVGAFSMYDFYNSTVAEREQLLRKIKGSHDHTWMPVEEVVACFIPKEFPDDAKARMKSLLTRIVVSVARGDIRKSDVRPDQAPPENP